MARAHTVRRLVTIAVLGALVVPVVRDHDSFPLSTYPMYAHNRDREVALATVVGIDDTGAVVRLSMPTIADSDDALEASSLVRGEVRAGRAADLCRAVAGRAAADLARIEVVTESHDTVELTAGRASLLDREVHARCEVGS